MSSVCSTRSAIAPAGIAIGNITAPDDRTRRPLPLSSVSPIAEWPSPSRWPISCVATDSRSMRPASPPAAVDHWKRRVEVDVRLEQHAGGRIEQERRRAEHPFLVGAIEEPERRAAVDLERLAAREALGAEADRQFGQRVPRRRRPADRIGEGLGADARGCRARSRSSGSGRRSSAPARPGRPPRRRTSGRPRRAPAAPPGPRPARPPADRASGRSWLLLHRPHGRPEGGQDLDAASRRPAHHPSGGVGGAAPASARPAARPTADRARRGRPRARARPATASPAPGRAGTRPRRRRA